MPCTRLCAPCVVVCNYVPLQAAVPGGGTGAGGGGASSYTLQVKWKYKGMDVDNGGYTKDAINRLFTK